MEYYAETLTVYDYYAGNLTVCGYNAETLTVYDYYARNLTVCGI
jgi:hypothetical protein